MKQTQPPRLTLLALAALAALATRPALADDDQPQNLGVVEVTGQSRVQQLQVVPITMSVVGADAIKSSGATTMGGLDGLIPGLSVDYSEATQPEYTMRGISTGDFGIGTDAPVGVYLNGVYSGKTGGALLTFNDVKRIEVLKGPQGTLFGRNSAGGAISIVQNDPTSKYEASALVRAGNDGQYHGEVLYNNALNDSTDIRFSAVKEHKDGWITNTFDGSKFGGDNGWGTRLSLRWHGEDTTALLSWSHEDMAQKPREIIALPSDTKLATNPFPIDPNSWVSPIRNTFANDGANLLEARKYDSVTLKLTHDLEFATLTSLSSYKKFHAQNVQDNDGSDVPTSYFSTGNFESSRNWQQEFRLNGATDKLDWVVGLSGYYEDAAQQTALYSNAQTLDTVFGGASGGLLKPFAMTEELATMFGIPGINFTNMTWTESMYNTGKYKAAAIYGDVIWKLTPDTDFTVGVRFTHDAKTFTWYNPPRTAPAIDATVGALAQGGFYQGVNANQAAIAASQGLTNAQLQGALVGAGLSPNLGDDLYALSTTNVNFNSPEATNAVLSNSVSWNNTSPRFVLDHHLDRDTMLFGSVTRGYQAGGFNAIYKSGVSTFSPETITSYEAGIKGGLKSAGLFYTASLFHYDFNNLQSISTSHSASGVLTYVVSVSDQKADGADLDLHWQLDRHWSFNAAAEYINQTYKHYSYQPDTTHTFVMDGEPVGTPKLEGTLGVNARYGVLGGTGTMTANWVYTGGQRCNDETSYKYECGNYPGFSVGAPETRTDLNLGWEAPSRKWGVNLVVTNLFNRQYVGYVSSIGEAVGAPTAWVTPPRSVAVEGSMKF
ncbi:MAG: TonB-dependent receptor [Pelomonas sp.]|nr:TonB-dependent receptor [Roseateles sp.]